MMSNNSKAVITMPTEFHEGLFLPLEDDECLVGMFSESKADADAFISILNDEAGKLSEDFNGDEWVLAVHTNPENCLFLLWTKDDNKTFRVKGSKLPSADNCQHNDEHGYDLNGDKHEDVVVDNKVFGLMAMLNTFNTYGHSNNEDVIWVYVHEAQALNEYISGIEGDLRERGSECSAELDNMMYIISLFLDNISDDYELGVFDRNDEE